MSRSPADRMTPRERMAAFLQGKQADRVPCAPLILNHAARVLGVKVSEYNRDGRTMGEAHAAAFERYGHDFIFVFSTTSTLAEAMGTVLFFPDDDAPWVESPVVGAPGDLGRVRIPDPARDGRLPVYLEAVRVCNERVGRDVFVGCVLAGPFTTAAALRGTETFIRETYRNPDLVCGLLERATEAALRFIDAILAAGGVPVLVEPVASGSLISPAQFDRFAAPYLRPLAERIKGAGLPCILHICGRTSKLLERMRSTGASALSLDVIDLAEAKARVGEEVCLIGNVRPAETLLKGTPADVAREARGCIEAAGDNPGGFILSSGCEVPLETPPENLLAMMEAARASRP